MNNAPINIPQQQQQLFDVNQQNEKKVSHILFQMLIIESVCAYYLDYNLFLFILRIFQLFSISRMKRAPPDHRYVIAIALLSSVPAFFSHLFLQKSGSSLASTDHYILNFFQDGVYSLPLSLFVDCLIVLFQYLFIVVRSNSIARSEEQQSPSDQSSDSIQLPRAAMMTSAEL